MSSQITMDEINILPNDITDLLTFYLDYEHVDFENLTYKKIMRKCISLMSMDNEIYLVHNNGITLTYPSHLIAPILQRPSLHEDSDFVKHKPKSIQYPHLKTFMKDSSLTRKEQRFPVPVILFNGKYICRSSTPERGYLINQMMHYDTYFSGLVNDLCPNQRREITTREESFKDATLLKLYGVNTIIDLSLKSNREINGEKFERSIYYEDFEFNCLPYPNSDFFSSFRTNGWNGRNIFFNWESEEFKPALSCSTKVILLSVNLFKSWDMLEITQNYFDYIQTIFTNEKTSGILLHCLEGKDQTALFTSLLRLSLWADEAIHHNLDALQILYFTIAYDWLLFGHNLKQNNLEQKHFLIFCFYVLPYIGSAKYSIRKDQDMEHRVRRKDRLMLVKGLFYSACKKLNLF